MQKEIEIKFKIEPEDNIRERLFSLGGTATKSYSQRTYGFFSGDSIERGIFPRIREENGRIVLTVKVKDLKNENKEYFERQEYSVSISDLEVGIEILKLLGFDKVRTFEKKREEWEFVNLSVVVDRLYFGTFMEIEGEKEDIEKMIVDLGFEHKQRITETYLALEDEYKENEK